jgi:ribonuclease HII
LWYRESLLAKAILLLFQWQNDVPVFLKPSHFMVRRLFFRGSQVMAPDFAFETDYLSAGSRCIAGIDEAGRGPLAGPVIAAAVILDSTRIGELGGVDDSKKLTAKKREDLVALIIANCVGWAVGRAEVDEIESLNILQAALLAMQRAVAALYPAPDLVLVDGPFIPQVACPAVPIIRGDQQSLSIAAASIIAKVTRDAILADLHVQYPLYGFDRHKGYGTRQHRDALIKYGPCPQHRRSFLKRIFESKDKTR